MTDWRYTFDICPFLSCPIHHPGFAIQGLCTSQRKTGQFLVGVESRGCICLFFVASRLGVEVLFKMPLPLFPLTIPKNLCPPMFGCFIISICVLLCLVKKGPATPSCAVTTHYTDFLGNKGAGINSRRRRLGRTECRRVRINPWPLSPCECMGEWRKHAQILHICWILCSAWGRRMPSVLSHGALSSAGYSCFRTSFAPFRCVRHNK